MIRVLQKAMADFMRLQSSIDGLKRILPRKVFRQLLLTTPDRRFCFESAAALSGRPVPEIVHEVASKLNLPVLPKIAPIAKRHDLELPEQSRLQIAGAIPLCSDQTVIGVVCVDPALMRAVLPEFSALPVFISSWGEIQKALGSDPKDESPENFPVCSQVLHHLVQEIRKHQSDICTIRFDDVVSYHIPINQSQKAYGEINNSVRGEILAGLMSHSTRAAVYRDIETQISYSISGSGDTFEMRSLEAGNKKVDLEDKHQIKILEPVTDYSGAVLLVDDNVTFARVLDRFLQKQGIKTTHMIDGEKALNVLRSGIAKPALIICDIHMPVMNGFEFVRQLHADEALSHIPLLMLTSDGDVEAEITLLSYGVEAFIGKNEDPRILCMHVKRILDRINRIAA